MPNFSLNFVPIAVRNSLLAGMPTTTVPSFLAAANVFSHSVCDSAGLETEGKLMNKSRTVTMASHLAGCLKTLSESFDQLRTNVGRFQMLERIPIMLRFSKHSVF